MQSATIGGIPSISVDQPAKEILSIVSDLNHETSEMDKMIERLESRLSPVIRMSPMGIGAEIKPDNPLSSPLASQILAETRTVRALRDRIESLLENIEL